MQGRSKIGEVSLTISAEQVAAAPREVREWFYRLIGAPAPGGRIVEHNGFHATEDNQAILGQAEAGALVARLENDAIATAVLAQFADDCWDPQTGTHHSHWVSVSDIMRRTDLASPLELRDHLDRIEAAVREGRGDSRVTLFQGNAHLGYRVHPQTQSALHRLRHRDMAHPALAMPEFRDAGAKAGG